MMGWCACGMSSSSASRPGPADWLLTGQSGRHPRFCRLRSTDPQLCIEMMIRLSAKLPLFLKKQLKISFMISTSPALDSLPEMPTTTTLDLSTVFSTKVLFTIKAMKKWRYLMSIMDRLVVYQWTILLNLIFWMDLCWPVHTTGLLNFGTLRVRSQWEHFNLQKIMYMMWHGIQPTQVFSPASTMTEFLTFTTWPEIWSCRLLRRESVRADWTSADGITKGQRWWRETVQVRWVCTFWLRSTEEWTTQSTRTWLNTWTRLRRAMIDWIEISGIVNSIYLSLRFFLFLLLAGFGRFFDLFGFLLLWGCGWGRPEAKYQNCKEKKGYYYYFWVQT